MEVFIPTHSKSMRFKPHYNAAIGEYIYTKDDYLKKIKELGLEPQKASYVQPSKSKTYTPSSWARAMIEAVKNSSKDQNGNPRLGDKFWDSLRSRDGGARELPDYMKSKLTSTVGGFC